MPQCWLCCERLGESDMGLQIKPVYFERSAKSGRLVAQGDRFPDGEVSRYICSDCTQEFGDMLGLWDQGHDIPEEYALPTGTPDVIQEEDTYGPTVHGLWPGYIPRS